MYNILDQRLQFLPGVGPEKANILQAELDIRTVRDLLLYFPYRYVDRSVIYRICELTNDMPYVQLRGKVLSASEEGLGRSRRYEASFSDDSGIVKLVWFAGINYIKKTVVPGREFVVLGKPVLFNMTYSLSHPEIEEIKTQNLKNERNNRMGLGAISSQEEVTGKDVERKLNDERNSIDDKIKEARSKADSIARER